MRVLIYCADQNPSRDRSLGITGYTDGLVAHLTRDPGISVEVVTSASSWAPAESSIRRFQIPFRTDNVAGRLLADHGHCWLPLPRADLVLYPKGFMPYWFPHRIPAVATVHDVILQHYADHYPCSRSRAAFAYWIAVLKKTLTTADATIVPSHCTQRQVLEFCARHRVEPPSITVTGMGCRWMDAPHRPCTKGAHALHLASTLPHKQTRALVHLWERFADRNSSAPRLRLVGNVTPDVARLCHGNPRFELLAPVAPDELRQQIESALALVLPSEIEGFGLPALESYCLGTPVAYVRNTAVEEILGPGTAGGFVLGDEDSFMAAMEEVLSLPPEAIASIRLSLRERFSWESCARKSVEVFRSVCGREHRRVIQA